MQKLGLWAAPLGYLAIVSMSGCATWLFHTPPGVVVDNWANHSAVAARRLLEEYGYPHNIRNNSLTWLDNGPWKKTTVYNRTPLYTPTAADHSVVMEQTLDYPLTYSQAANLRSFSSVLVADVQRGELTARADREEISRLNFNLADDIVKGRKTVEEAKAFYVKILELDNSGRSSPYTEGLLFKFGR